MLKQTPASGKLSVASWRLMLMNFTVLPLVCYSHVSLQVSSLFLNVEEAHNLPSKHFTNAYCNIYLNSIQVAKTHPREGQNPVWTEEFIFE